MRFVTKSKEDPNDTKKASVVKYDIFIPQYLRSGSVVGPIMRKKWTQFVSHQLILLFNKSGIISDKEMNKLEGAKTAAIWDGRIESLLHANRRAVEQLQKEIEEEVRKRPEGSITTDEKERNTYLLMKYKERVDWMVQNNQIVCDGLTENETVFGMKRLTSSLFVSSVEYHLENPLWKHVVVHLHKGEYEAISSVGEDRRFHIYVPYLFEEGDLVEFMKANLKRLEELARLAATKKLL
ncbi:hypothetical protein WA577_004345 [Blastocystis sp. JDR]